MRLGGLQKFSLSDFPGTPAAIIFTQGCNFRCPFCHNGSLLPTAGEHELDVEEVLSWLKTRSGKLEGVVVTGGEPTIHADLPDFLATIRGMGYKIKLDSNGSNPKMLKQVIQAELVDYIAMDIKADWGNYERLCGTPVDLEKINRSIEILANSGTPHLFRTTEVKELMSTHEIANIERMLPASSNYSIQTFKPETAWNM
ncbi:MULTISPECIES: anaerobic ribonucleoside-triphosphate reductase activating protein [Desulfosediminicola]|uniref:anaerobic ribonucleoside-triphosphate reductase activating protein n=1 Tax=Desulfosediminicola TaxID=2886823 RepID=UPI0010AD3973|nr:anaerobic ribonucleoside-triphosphate reductase activating protein [Desulfosediminicola ganghwensis]